ncbi:MAG: PAS domain S-box protein [Spirochaetota bacterium]
MDIALDLVNNLSLLLVLTVGYDYLTSRIEPGSWRFRLVSAALFGVVVLIAMMTHVRIASGVIYDGRSIVLLVAGYLGGPFVAAVAGAVALAYRLWLGGVGALAGSLVIVEAAVIGAVAFALRRRNAAWERTGRVFLIALTLHLLMVASQLTLPGALVPEMLVAVAPPVVVLYPAIATLILRIVLDRQEQRVTRHALRDSEERYRNLFENTYAPMLIIDPDDGSIVDANRIASDYYGWSHDELCSMKISEINVLAAEEVETEMRAARTSDRNYFEFRHRRKDRSVRDVAVYSGTVSTRAGDLLYSIIRDITDQRTMEKELYLLGHAVDHAAVAVFRIAEPDGRIQYVNEQACASLGYARGELLSMTVVDIDPEFDMERWVAHRRELGMNGSRTIESVHRRKDGSTFPVSITVTSFEYRGERYSLSFATDISQRRRAEAELVGSLEQKEALLREVHHRVKNNLAVMSGLVQLQLNEIDDGAVERTALAKTNDRIVVMGLIHNLLYQEHDLSRLDAGGLLGQIVGHLQDQYAPGGSPRVTVNADDLTLNVDRALPLGLIVSEAVTNALVHGAPGNGGHIAVELRVGEDGSSWITIADTGPGLPSDFSLDAQRTLGFSLMRMLTHQIQASLHVEGSSEGTTVTVRL